MGTTENKLEHLSGTKSEIKQPIINQGVPVPNETTFREYADKIMQIERGGYVPPPDWPDISNVNNNEIKLLMCDLFPISFTVTAAGGFAVDWGDGTMLSTQTSGATAPYLRRRP